MCAFVMKLTIDCIEILIFSSNSAKTVTLFSSEFFKMEIREDNYRTTIIMVGKQPGHIYKFRKK